MYREEDSFRMHARILSNEKWVCNFCGYEYSGDTTRIRAHLAGVAGYGIQGCENVDSQVRSKALTAWKGKRPAKSSNRQRYLEGGPHLRATPNDEDDCIVTSFAALPDLTSDVISTVAPSSSAFLPLPETVNNEDDWTVTLPVARPDPSSGVMSTVNASSSAFLPLPKTNLPNQSLPPQNMNPQGDFPFWPQRPQSHAVDSYPLPWSFSRLIRFICFIGQRDLVSKDLTNMLRPVNAEVEEPNSKVPQGTFSRDHRKKINYRIFDRMVKYVFEGRNDNIRSNSDELMKLNSLPDGGTGWRKIGKIYVSRKEIAKGSNGTIVLEGIYEDRPVAVKRLVRAHCDVASNEIQILMASDRHKNIVRYHGVEYDPDFVYLALERCACSLDDLIQLHSDSSNNSAFRGDPASTVDSYLLPRSLSHLIRVIRQPDLVSKDLTNMLRLANAKVEEPNTKVPQGTLSRDHKKKIKYGSFGRKDSLSNGGTEWRKIGKIHVSRKEIAKGSNGTIVLEGIYEGRPVAVKRLVRAHCDVASNEIQILLASDQHKNIVRYHGVESNSDFVYLALKRCACSLYDLIQAHSDSSNNSAFRGDPASTDDHKIKLDSVRDMMQDVDLWRADGHPSPLLQKLMRNVVSGLSHLHDLRIIHRDLKPQNVLITKNRPFCAQLSDMGISKCLPEDKSSLGYHATGCGTSGWRAPELLLHGGRQTPAMDAFSLGCVLCFCFTRGRHPFGENLERDHNIVCNKMDLSFVDIPEAHDLFSCLLNQDPKLRPKTSEVLHHPFFWSSKVRLTFLHDISDEVESEARKGNLDLLNALENIAQSVFDGSWDEKIDKDVMDDLRQHRRMPYDGSCVRDLLRVVRNKFNHLRHAPEKVKAIHGSDPNGLDAYFAKRFSRLLIESYKVVSQSCKKEKLLAGVLSK